MTNIVSVSWGDHLVFGEGEGRLDTPVAVYHRMQTWREDLNAKVIHWRVPRKYLDGKFYTAKDYPRTQEERGQVDWAFEQIIPTIAHKLGMQVHLQVSIFDEGWPLPSKRIREKSYHNAMHGQHISWQSNFSRQNPDYTVVDRAGENSQWGVMSLSYLVVRSFFRERFSQMLANTSFDGLFVCLRSQSRPPDFADEFGFNEPIRLEFQKRYERDILTEDFDLQLWRDLQGEYLTQFLRMVKADLKRRGLRLGIGAPRGDVIGPPLGNITLPWRDWITSGIIDDLVINQNSSRCPSMGHDLWPMHRGYGYIQNYLDGHNLPELGDHLENTYAPVFNGRDTEHLYIARQWDVENKAEEAELSGHPAVSGLVFSSFQHDHPGLEDRDDWIA